MKSFTYSCNMSSITVPEFLSYSSEKRMLYAMDTYFRECWEDSLQYLGEFKQLYNNLAVIIFKPEAIAARRIFECIDFLKQFCFYPLVAKPYKNNRHIYREMWRYQCNTAPRERLDIMDLVGEYESLFVILRLNKNTAYPASEILSAIKGPANPELRTPRQLRYILNQTNTLLNHIHTSDEPIDIIREIGICFDYEDRISIFKEIDNGTDYEATLKNLVDSLYDKYPYCNITARSSISIIHEIAEYNCLNSSLVLEIEDMIRKLEEGMHWRKLLLWFEKRNIQLSNWDKIQLVSDRNRFLPLPNVERILPVQRSIPLSEEYNL